MKKKKRYNKSEETNQKPEVGFLIAHFKRYLHCEKGFNLTKKISAKTTFALLFISLLVFTPQEIHCQNIKYVCPEGAKLRTDILQDFTVYSCSVDNALQGTAKGYYKNGKVKFVNYWEKGKPVGTWKEWDKKENLFSITEYKNGVKDGVETFFFENGNRKVITTFKNGIKNGRIDEWSEDGVHLLDGNFKNGLEDGLWFMRLNENKIVAVQFQKGQKLFEKEQDLKGTKLPEVKYK